ncbi:hypothetical protein [Aliiruegeria sabulilitoris]|uniref:hypothetical protein n=1 Tax=Aliiruegeria sabulilitoris TaxID=1510458 RepID=UPI00083217C1|nr:hypothetical protein [Aliiruegeria sabulilitoris]
MACIVSLRAQRFALPLGELHSFPIDGYTTRPDVFEDSLAVAPDTPGTGVVFDWDKLNAANDLAA